ncbi:MAG: ATP-binding protein [Gammaproteobacteria bacterium]|nr:hypothetical protein [Chlamydiales bacterium]MCH9645019.1 ATP-binding protein [Gammaproteobacteria bacterium]
MEFDGIPRYAESKIRKLLKLFPIVAIIGARQVGKTTLAKKIGLNWKYFDLEDESDFDLISTDTKFFFNQYPSEIILDEAQEYPALFRVLRGVVDQNPKKKGRYLLTGSSSPDLLKNLSESLAGRVAIVELGTLKAREYYQKPLSPFYQLFEGKLSRDALPKKAPDLTTEQMQRIWLKGGYPEPLIEGESVFYNQWMDNYRKTYLNRDIARLFPKLNKLAYRRFLSMLCQLSGTIINKSELGRAIEVSESTIKDYLDIAEGTFLFRVVPSFEKNVEKTITKLPKGYIRDTGLLHYLLKLEELEDLLSHPVVGKSFEGFVVDEISKGLHATMITNWQCFYYRTLKKAEIDFIFHGPFGILPIEIKRGVKIDRRQLRALSTFVDEHHLPFGLLINQSEQPQWISEKIFQLPVGWI